MVASASVLTYPGGVPAGERTAWVASRGHTKLHSTAAESYAVEAGEAAVCLGSDQASARMWRAFSAICVAGYARDGQLVLREPTRGALVDVFS